LQLHHNGRYHCKALVDSGSSSQWMDSAAVTLTVTSFGVPLSGVSLSVQTPGTQVALGDHLVLSCTVAAGTGPLSFSWHWGGSRAPLGTGPCLELLQVGVNDSSHYQCRASNGDSEAKSLSL
ncbi:FCRL2 protein, partial [Rhipidura dahli]|nr:FCRL2 protein [Rhipidura dahli]